MWAADFARSICRILVPGQLGGLLVMVCDAQKRLQRGIPKRRS